MATSVSQGIFNYLFNLYMVIALLVGALVIGWLLYSLWRYRATPDSPRPRDAPVPGVLPAERGRAIWSWLLAVAIGAIMLGLAFSTISAVDTLEHPPEGREWQHHNVTGFQFGWKYNYTGEGGVPFQLIGSWKVPVDTPVVLNVTSQDVWHNYAIADFRIRIDAIPGEVNRIWFEAQQTGLFPNVCVQICGTSHALMKAEMEVLTQAEYETWLAEETTRAYDKLANDAAKDPRRGAIRFANLTSDGIEPGDNATVTADKYVVFQVGNQQASPVTFSAGGNSVTVAPGATGRLYALAPATGEIVLSSSAGPSASYQVVSL